MKKLLIVIYVIGAILMGYEAMRPTEIVETTVRVQTGDSIWSICNEHYLPNSKDCFNEFYAVSVRANGSDIHPGDLVLLKQEIYK